MSYKKHFDILIFRLFYLSLTCKYYTVLTLVSKIGTMEHFCTLFIFRGLFFSTFRTLCSCKFLSKNRHFTKSPEIYSTYEDNRQQKIARTKGKLFIYLGIIKLTSRLNLKSYLTTIFKTVF